MRKLFIFLALALTLMTPVRATSVDFAEVNNSILASTIKYINQSSLQLKKATALYLLAATNLENRGTHEEVFSSVRIADDGSYGTISSTNLNSTPAYSGYQLGPLSLSPLFHKYAINKDMLGINADGSIRYDISGQRGCRMNWEDSVNMAVGLLDFIWANTDIHIDTSNDYLFVALTSAAMHQGTSVLEQGDNFMPKGQIENASPAFWEDFCKIVTQPKFINQIRGYVLEKKPAKYSNDTDINNELLIPILKQVRADALASNTNFFSYNRYQAKTANWVNGGTEYNQFVGGPAEKTSAILKVLISYIIVEERYKGSW